MANFLESLGNTSIHLVLFTFGLLHTLPYLVVSYSDFGGAWLFLGDTLESLSYCLQPLLGSGQGYLRVFKFQ
jgi:hypothetical protein